MAVAQFQASRPEVRMALVQKTRIHNSGTTQMSLNSEVQRSSETQPDQSKVVWVKWVRTLESDLEVSRVHTVTGSDPDVAQLSSLEPLFVSQGQVHGGSGPREQNQNQLWPRTTVWISEQNLNHQDQDQIYQNQDPNHQDQEEDEGPLFRVQGEG